MQLEPRTLIAKNARCQHSPRSFVPCQGLPQVRLDLIDDHHPLVEPIHITYQSYTARLRRDPCASESDVDKAPDGIGQFGHVRTWLRLVIGNVDGVVGTKLGVADDPGAPCQRRACDCIVEAADESRSTDQVRNAERRWLARDNPLDEGQDLPSHLIDTEKSGRSLEPTRLQEVEEVMDERGVRPDRTSDSCTNPDDAWCHPSPSEGDLIGCGHGTLV